MILASHNMSDGAETVALGITINGLTVFCMVLLSGQCLCTTWPVACDDGHACDLFIHSDSSPENT